SWGASGMIVFARQGLWTVASAGGQPQVLIEPSSRRQLSPVALPGGETVLFTESASGARGTEFHVESINLTTKVRRTLLTDAADARYSPTGHIVFMRDTALVAAPF